MAKLKRVKVADTISLCELADEARVRDLNRQLDAETIDALDPEGIHVLFFAMPHKHRDTEVYDPHFRTVWMLKVKGRVEPMKATLDIMADQFNALPERETDEEADTEEE